MRPRQPEVIFENIALFLYISAVALVTAFHEPWYDEAQAWLIVRDNSIFDMLWQVLRYEGHTPLWHLFLYIPVRLGVPFELGIKAANLVFVLLAAAVLVKKSPFPLWARLLLPFTYFPFYQYGVLSRSYSLLALALWLTAAAMPSRNRSPVKFALLLALLGSITAHGILIAFGLAAAWFIEILGGHRKAAASLHSVPGLLMADKRFHALLFLGSVNVVYAAILWPMPDKLTPLQTTTVDIGGFLLKFFIAPLEAVATDVWPGAQNNSPDALVLALVGGFLFTAVFFIWALNKGMSLFILFPYFCTALFMSCIYFAKHHTGIYAFLIIFCLWVSRSKEQPFHRPLWVTKIPVLLPNTVGSQGLVRRLSMLCAVFIFAIQLYWSAAASVNDIRLPYVPARDLASFIQNNGIEGRRIFNCYNVWFDEISYALQNMESLAYFSKNIFYNHNFGKENISYCPHKNYDEKAVIQYLKRSGDPDFIVEYKYPITFYPTIASPEDFIPVAAFQGNYMWKARLNPLDCTLYIRKDLLGQYAHLRPLENGIKHLVQDSK